MFLTIHKCEDGTVDDKALLVSILTSTVTVSVYSNTVTVSKSVAALCV